MTILMNMMFNVLSTSLGIMAFYATDPYSYVLKIKYMSFLYFIMDSVIECYVYRRLEYIPHHVLSLASAISITQNHPMQFVSLVFVFAESTSFVCNLRYVLKSYDALEFRVEMYLFGYFVLCRFFFIPSIIYHLYEYKLLFYSGIFITCMSYNWGYKWARSIYYYHLKSD